VTLFDETGPAASERPRRPRSRAGVAGIWALVVALVALLVLSFLPSAYVIETPGPVFNTLGTVQNDQKQQVPIITVSGATTYPTAGELSLLTVQVVGTADARPSWLELIPAFFDPSRSIVPADAIYPPDQTSQQLSDQSSAQMVDSQQEATAAALTHLGYTVTPYLSVYSVESDGAANGVLQKDDVVESADGTAVTDVASLRAIIAAKDGAPVSLTIQRGGATQQVSITPKQQIINGQSTWLIGVSLLTQFHFPIDVKLQLFNVGGPSAGMMFALGIIDTLTPGNLNGGKNVAGTGTIDAAGEVGAIGGIRQKMYGARSSGAEYFLAPADNCDEVVGHIPQGLSVYAVSTLDDAVKDLTVIGSGGDTSTLATCSTVMASPAPSVSPTPTP